MLRLSPIRRIEKKDVTSEEELEIERLKHAPVLGQDAWYACLWWSLWRMITTQMLTRAGLWCFTSAMTLFALVGSILYVDELHDGMIWVAYGAGANYLLAWMWYCAPAQAKEIMEAVAARIRGREISENKVLTEINK
jgi:hypothetical protein